MYTIISVKYRVLSVIIPNGNSRCRRIYLCFWRNHIFPKGNLSGSDLSSMSLARTYFPTRKWTGFIFYVSDEDIFLNSKTALWARVLSHNSWLEQADLILTRAKKQTLDSMRLTKRLTAFISLWTDVTNRPSCNPRDFISTKGK